MGLQTDDFEQPLSDRRPAALSARIKEQDSRIQKVSAQLEASKPAPQVVNNP